MLVWMIILFFLLLIAVLLYGSSVIGSGMYLRAKCRLNTPGKLLALTFDDGPHPEFTPIILDILARYQLPAAFFCIGREARKYPEIVRRMHQEGHLVGNHSYTHAACLPLFSTFRMEKEIRVSRKILERILRPEAAVWFRPPFGVTNPTVARVVGRLRLQVMGWNVRSFDGGIHDADRVILRVCRKLKPGSIVLLHDNRENSGQIVQAIVEYALEQGYRFVRADK